ncbi:DinB family protein [Myroides marinus]|uniref:DinB family protein n=1 Tax=Myroides marinus TaxID=703342 RepID=UPI0025781B7A|nr:DinB family protein [Myroides marinus]MDM1532403.1 DinB family protein [Myroides marinus]MDM1539365.1 DinB family protein [Myroides marinus]
MSHLNYIKRAEGYKVEDALLNRIPVIVETLEEITKQNKWNFAYAEGKWTLKEVVQHLIDCERIFSYRALHIARQDTSILSGFDENIYVDNAKGEDKGVSELVEEYVCLMKSIYFEFKGFTKDALALSNQVANYVVTVEEIGKIMYGHSLHHLDVIKERYLD